MAAIPKPRREKSLSRLAWCRQQPCLVRPNPLYVARAGSDWECIGHIDPHHVIPKGGGKAGSKVSDYRTVPLCRKHHDEAQSGRDAFERKYAIIFEYEIERLNREYRTLHPQPRKERKASMKVKLTIQHCAECGHFHEIPWNKVTLRGRVAEFRCVNKNAIIEVAK